MVGPLGAWCTDCPNASRVHLHPQGPLLRELGSSITLLMKLNCFIKCQGSRWPLPPAASSVRACALCISQEPASPTAGGLGVTPSLLAAGLRALAPGEQWGRVKRSTVCSVAAGHFTCSAACEEQ